jgi:hypothetical protein
LLAELLRVIILALVIEAPLSIAKLVTVGEVGALMVTERKLDQLETTVVWVAHRALALT